MNTSMLLRYALDWVPFLTFLGLMIFFLRKIGFGSRHAEYQAFMQRYCTDHLEETRKISDSLQRIARALEQSKSP